MIKNYVKLKDPYSSNRILSLLEYIILIMMHRFKVMQQSIPPAPTANSLTHATVNSSGTHVPLPFFELTPRYKHFMTGMTNSQGLEK